MLLIIFFIQQTGVGLPGVPGDPAPEAVGAGLKPAAGTAIAPPHRSPGTIAMGIPSIPKRVATRHVMVITNNEYLPFSDLLAGS